MTAPLTKADIERILTARIRALEEAERTCKVANESQRRSIAELEASLRESETQEQRQFEAWVAMRNRAEKAEALAKERGMVKIAQDALLKALEGKTTFEEVLRISHE